MSPLCPPSPVVLACLVSSPHVPASLTPPPTRGSPEIAENSKRSPGTGKKSRQGRLRSLHPDPAQTFVTTPSLSPAGWVGGIPLCRWLPEAGQASWSWHQGPGLWRSPCHSDPPHTPGGAAPHPGS
ncbi:protein MMP24OS isoform X2 [Gorilla gorilla gorilla]|uniref:protein MMP24OS isoform X2 n=1 Tax=Gorilla gorilla gorilla TaxID=9595 RepID=UPI00300A620D